MATLDAQSLDGLSVCTSPCASPAEVAQDDGECDSIFGDDSIFTCLEHDSELFDEILDELEPVKPEDEIVLDEETCALLDQPEVKELFSALENQGESNEQTSDPAVTRMIKYDDLKLIPARFRDQMYLHSFGAPTIDILVYKPVNLVLGQVLTCDFGNFFLPFVPFAVKPRTVEEFVLYLERLPKEAQSCSAQTTESSASVDQEPLANDAEAQLPTTPCTPPRDDSTESGCASLKEEKNKLTSSSPIDKPLASPSCHTDDRNLRKSKRRSSQSSPAGSSVAAPVLKRQRKTAKETNNGANSAVSSSVIF